MMNADGFAGFSRRQQRIGTRGISPVPGACLPVGVVVETDDSLQNNEGRSDWRTSPDRCGHVRFTPAGMSALCQKRTYAAQQFDQHFRLQEQ
jgi:hypothetical protein